MLLFSCDEAFVLCGHTSFWDAYTCIRVKSTDTPTERIVLERLGGVMKNVGAEYSMFWSWSGFISSDINETAKQFFKIRL